MKLELLFAAALLAVGCLLCNSQPFAGFLNVASSNQPMNAAANFLSEKGQGTSQFEPAITFTSSQTPTTQTKATGNQLLAQAAYNLDQNVSIKANVRITMMMFDEEIVAEGVYYHLGNQRRGARLEFTFGEGADSNRIQQISDGRFYYTITEDEENGKRIKFVDLERVAVAVNSTQSVVGAPTDLLSTGSISSLLQNLSAAFEMGTVDDVELGGVPMWSFTGTWSPAKLAAITRGIVDPVDVQSEVNWKGLPPQIPHAVHITLGKDDFLPLFPYRIQFFKYSEEQNSFSQPMVMMELYEVTKVPNMPLELFIVDSDGFEITNETERYIARILHLNHENATQTAHAPQSSQKR